jgi:hypothetical protein
MSTAPLPWYREPWPWILMGLPAIAVVASLASGLLALDGADPVVTDNYYQRGLDVNRDLERLRHAAEGQVHASVEFDGVDRGQTIWVRVRAAVPLHDASLRIRLVHPGRSVGDRTAVLARVPGSAEDSAEFTGFWTDDAAPEARLGGRTINWRINLQGADWQLQGDAAGKGDIAAH